MSESVSTDFGGLGKKGAIFLTLKQGQLFFTLGQSQPNQGGGEEDDEFLTLKQGHLFLILLQSQFLLTFWGEGEGGGDEISYLETGSAIFDPRAESVSSDFIVGSESAKK